VSVEAGAAVVEKSTLSRAVGRHIEYVGLPALSWEIEDVVAVLYPVEYDGEEKAAQTDLEAMRRRVSDELGTSGCSLGIGRVHRGLRGVPKAFREAREALEVVRAVGGGDRTMVFDELGIYRLLLGLRGSGELELYFGDYLGQLSRYDDEQGTELVSTLEAFLGNNGNVVQTARALDVHRNTVVYRLERIQEITGADLDSAEDRLNVSVAVKIGHMRR
jgi:purine catabolism regulator